MAFPWCMCDKSEHTDQDFLPDGRISYDPAGQNGQAERRQLQEFVKDFAKCAVRGIQCETIDKEGGMSPIEYFIDPALTRIIMKNRTNSASGEEEQEEILLSDIKELLRYDAVASTGSSSSSLMPPGVAKALTDDSMRSSLVVIHFSNGRQPIFLLEGSAVDRDRFIVCIQVIKVFAQKQHGLADMS